MPRVLTHAGRDALPVCSYGDMGALCALMGRPIAERGEQHWGEGVCVRVCVCVQ